MGWVGGTLPCKATNLVFFMEFWCVLVARVHLRLCVRVYVCVCVARARVCVCACACMCVYMFELQEQTTDLTGKKDKGPSVNKHRDRGTNINQVLPSCTNCISVHDISPQLIYHTDSLRVPLSLSLSLFLSVRARACVWKI